MRQICKLLTSGERRISSALYCGLAGAGHLLRGHLNSAGGTALISDWLIFLGRIVASRAI
jgi:hypothetical protein